MMATGGFSGVARMLSEHFGLEPPLDRRQVYQWHKRGTRNQAGVPFPEPAHQDMSAPVNRPFKFFDYDEVLRWAEPGVPANHGGSWKRLGNLCQHPGVDTSEGLNGSPEHGDDER
jgi:hypothetical protein